MLSKNTEIIKSTKDFKDLRAMLSGALSEVKITKDQVILAKEIISVFCNQERETGVSQETGVSMVSLVIEIILENYPHLKKDMEKLLILL